MERNHSQQTMRILVASPKIDHNKPPVVERGWGTLGMIPSPCVRDPHVVPQNDWIQY